MELGVFVYKSDIELVEDPVYVGFVLRVGVTDSVAEFLGVAVADDEILTVFVFRVERDPVADIVDVRLIMLERV